MENWNQHVLSLIICSMSCWIITQISSDPKRREIMHLISGTVLTIFILQPLHQINYEDFFHICMPNHIASAELLEDGEKIAAQARAEYIKSSCEAYILARAKQLGADIRITISLDGNFVPVFAEITGITDFSVQKQLQDLLTSDLGIPKENQKWI